jgi:ABC-type transporter Mla subunit MlaD
MALLNELLEEAVTRCLAFTEHSETMHEATDTCGNKVKALGDKVRDEAAEAHGLFADLAAKLREAEDHLGHADTKAGSELFALRQRVEAVESKVDALVSAVKSAASELHDSQTRIAHELESHDHEIDARFDNDQQKMHALEVDMGQRLQTVHDALAALQHSVEEAQHNLQTTTTHFFERLDHFTADAHTHVQTLMEALRHQVDGAVQAFEAAGNEIVAEHNHVMDALRQEFHEHAPKEAETTFAEVKAAVEQLVGICHQKDGALAQAAGEISKQVQEVVDLTERLEPPLAEASRIR